MGVVHIILRLRFDRVVLVVVKIVSPLFSCCIRDLSSFHGQLYPGPDSIYIEVKLFNRAEPQLRGILHSQNVHTLK